MPILEPLTSRKEWAGTLRVTKSQLQTYAMCPRKYYYQYVICETAEFSPPGMVFGRVMHAAVAYFYERYRTDGEVKPPLEDVIGEFLLYWKAAVMNNGPDPDPEIRFDEKHTARGMETQGIAMLTKFHADIQPRHIDAVEYPFAVPLTDPDTGEVMDVALVGIIDLVESDDDGNRIVSELKTAAARMGDDKADDLLDGLIYAYALDQLGIRTTDEQTLVRIDVLVKTKTPSLQQVYVVKEAATFRELARTIKLTLNSIEAGAFHPVKSWVCKTCQFAVSCREDLSR